MKRLDRYAAAGQLLELAEAARVDDRDNGGASVSHWTIEHAAKVCALHGVNRALGFIDGFWYAAGNKEPKNNATWKLVRETLGHPVRWGEA